jgi:hypothetical protein
MVCILEDPAQDWRLDDLIETVSGEIDALSKNEWGYSPYFAREEGR